MKRQTGILLSGLVFCWGIPTLASGEEEVQRYWYGGIGIGISRLNPNPNNTGFRVDDDRSIGGKLLLGRDLTERLSIEGHYADLGEAAMSPNGEVGYQIGGISGLYRFFPFLEDDNFHRRHGFSAFINAGVGKMENDSDLNYRRKNDFNFLYGGGLEYGLGKGFSLRSEVTLYDEDARFFSFSLIKRFGDEKDRQVSAPVEEQLSSAAPAGDTFVPVVAPIPSRVLVPEPSDLDQDGVPDSSDACPGSIHGGHVDTFGCIFSGVLAGVSFDSGSAELTPQAKMVLDGVAQELLRFERVRVEIAAHTDSTDSEDFNQKLSEQRAITVRDYLTGKGVESERLLPKGYGETQPIDSNRTKQERRKNRRVEFEIIDM